MNTLTDTKLLELQGILKSAERVVIAWSGGTDSTFLLKTALDTLGAANVLAVIGDSESLPRCDLADALRLAATWHLRCEVITSGEMADPRYVANSPDRCYFCKQALFGEIRRLAGSLGFAVVCDGTNADDSGDRRPGRRAAREHGVRSPLLEAGLTKSEIRELSRRLALPTADKPAQACLASRLPYGTPVTREALTQIEAAETLLHELGFSQVRVRHHGDLARLELLPEELPRLADPELRRRIDTRLKALGYRYVSADLLGYRTGSLNEVLTPQAAA